MIRAKKKFGQNFLQDQNVIERIIQSFGPKPSDHIFEIGPGHGALTDQLVQASKDLNLVEIDRDLIIQLKEKYKSNPQVSLHPQDALTLKLEKPNTRIIGNLPYNISTPLLINFLYQKENIKDMLFMLQKEVVKRICAPCGVKAYGRLSVMMQYGFECEELFVVKPEAFIPAPKVDSQIIRLTKRSTCDLVDLPKFEETVKRSFAQRRKTIKNNLKKHISDEQLESLNINPQARAETLSVRDYVQLSHNIKL